MVPSSDRATDMTHPLRSTCIIGSVIALGLLAVAAPAAGEGLRIAVGDLTQPAAARDFDHRLDQAAHRFCYARYRPNELDQMAACRAAIREEGLAALSQDQRDALARSLGSDRQLASAGR